MSHFVLPTSMIPAPGDEAFEAMDTLLEDASEPVTEIIHPGEDEEPDTIELPPRMAGGRRWHELPSLASARRALSL